LTETAPAATIPAAWLKPLPDGYAIPLWRWIVLPATTFMLKRNGGAWISGTLALQGGKLNFTQARLGKSRNPPDSWTISLADVADISVDKRLASERIELRHSRGPISLMAVRSADFVIQLRQALPVS
jgi:hypothetical protein